MIGKLLKMHGVDYIISVDDCYSIEYDYDSIKASLFAVWNSHIESIGSVIARIGETERWDGYKEFLSPGDDNTSVFSDFFDVLGEEKVLSIYECCYDKMWLHGINSDYLEKKHLLTFLEKLKEKGYIKEFYTFSSTKEAMNEYSGLNIDSSGVLWLIDKNFSRVGEANDAGFSLAQNIIEGQCGTVPNYVFILSELEPDKGQSEDEIEKEFDKQLHGYFTPRTASFIYYLFKQRIVPEKMDVISIGLAQGFKRKACYQLFEDYINCVKTGANVTEKNLYSIKQNTLNYLLSERVPKEGESIWEFLVRFVDLFIQDEYRNALANNYTEFVKKIKYFKEINKNVESLTSNAAIETDLIVQYRKKEIYDYCVNKLHLEVTTGDIFRIDENYYILISQACDSCLRVDGNRVLKNATLLQVTNDFGGVEQFKYDLKVPFIDDLNTPIVDFKTVRSIPFELLDLCVLNNDGYASITICKNIDELLGTKVLFEDRFIQRMNLVNEELNKIVANNRIMEEFFEQSKEYSLDTIRMAYNNNKHVAPELLDYSVQAEHEVKVCYRIQRICRLQEILAIDIVRKYGNNVSRIGHSFDFAGKPVNRKKKRRS